MDFAFEISAAGGAVPPALTGMTVQLPAGMGIDVAGVATCARAALQAHGPRGCPREAQVGGGSVLVKVPLGEAVRNERAQLAVFSGPRSNGHLTLLFYAAGRVPIATQLIFSAVIRQGAGGASIQAGIPLIPTLPDQPDAAIVRLSAILGTRGRSYERIVRGRRVRFAPPGITVPRHCPGAGVRFSTALRFDDSSGASAGTAVACRR